MLSSSFLPFIFLVSDWALPQQDNLTICEAKWRFDGILQAFKQIQFMKSFKCTKTNGSGENINFKVATGNAAHIENFSKTQCWRMLSKRSCVLIENLSRGI